MIYPDRTPEPLQPGDLLRVIAPSGRLRERTALDLGVEIWRERGYRVEVSTEVLTSWGYLAGKDPIRRSELATAWLDPECRASYACAVVMGECDYWKIGSGSRFLPPNG
jgi:muramoyltetrapeptide carboxypeptidase